MARFNKDRAPAGLKIAAKLPALLEACKGGVVADKMAIAAAAYAVQFFRATNPSEHSRFEVYARALQMLAHIESGKAHGKPAKFAPALTLYAESLVAWSKGSDYQGAIELAGEAAKAA